MDFVGIWRLTQVSAQELVTAHRHWPQQQQQQQQGPDEALQPIRDAGRGLAPQQQQQQVAMDQAQQLARGGSDGLGPEQQQQRGGVGAGGDIHDAALEWYKLEQVGQLHLWAGGGGSRL